jgi:hypothetical protein
VLATRTGESVVLLDPRSGSYYSLDGVGARIWELSDGDHTVADITAALDAEYDAPAAAIESDALDLLRDLSAEGLVADG